MSRYTPADEKAAIDLLRLAGYAVVRQRTYDDLREKVTLADHRRQWDEQQNDHVRQWARDAFDAERRLADRLDRVVAAAAALGVSIGDINDALDDPAAPSVPSEDTAAKEGEQ